MNKKITISELSQLLSTNVSLINKKGWEDFLRIFFAQISEALKAEGNVKIKGLGTFKVVTVDARKSKDVNTGENTIIPAHNKISFTPDSSLAETLNKPYAHFEPTYVLAPEGEVDAPEIEDDEATSEPEVIAAAVASQTEFASQMTLSSETEAEEPKAETVVEEPKAEPIIEETKAETIIEESKAETVVEETKAETVVEENKAETVVEETKTETVVEENKAETVVEENKAETVVEENKAETIIEESKAEESKDSNDNESEESEEKEEEDPNADEDENIDITPEETKAYASTFKRHDIQETEDEDNDKGHGKKLGIAIILFLLILAVVGLVAWMSDPNIVSKMRDKMAGKESTVIEVLKVDPVELEETKAIEEEIIANKIESNAETANANVDTTAAKNEAVEIETGEVETEEVVEKPIAKKEVQATTKFKDDFISYMKTKHPEMDIMDKGDPIEEKLGNASRLTLVSLRHYGAKDFWIYIYLYNKDAIKNPNNIKAGTKIKVPMLDNKRFVNPDSEHSILTAKEIQHKFVK